MPTVKKPNKDIVFSPVKEQKPEPTPEKVKDKEKVEQPKTETPKTPFDDRAVDDKSPLFMKKVIKK